MRRTTAFSKLKLHNFLGVLFDAQNSGREEEEKKEEDNDDVNVLLLAQETIWYLVVDDIDWLGIYWSPVSEWTRC